MPNKLEWLPELICLRDYDSNWERYLDVIYEIFKDDFIKTQPIFKSKKVFAINNSIIDDKECGFWHLISEGEIEYERIPDLRRCERVAWPKSVINNSNCTELLIWIAKRKTKGGHSNKRVHMWLKDFDYIVVLSIRKKHYLLITAFLTDRGHTRRKLQKEYDSYNRRCRP